MEVQISVATGTDMAVVEAEYPDIYRDAVDADGRDVYFIGNSTDDEFTKDEEEWLTREEAIECCGFIEGALPPSADADTLLEGNDYWAQGMLRRTDFSGLAGNITDYKTEAALYQRGFAAGKATP